MKLKAALASIILLCLFNLAPVCGQTPQPTPEPSPATEPAEERQTPATEPATQTESNQKDEPPALAEPAPTPEESEEERAFKEYYRRLKTKSVGYLLGPGDIISVTVFNQPAYSKASLTVPPDGRIGLPLITEGVQVIGRTPIEIQDEITKKLDEYIIDPKVTVTLDKAESARYGIVGYIAAPGGKVMTRRLTVYEAIVEAGGIPPTGDKEKVILLRQTGDEEYTPKLVNIKNFERGQTEMVYLVPGDTIIVPKRGFSIKKPEDWVTVLSPLGIVRGIVPGLR